MRRLEEVFASTFHTKLTFHDFLSLNVENEYTKHEINNRIIYAPTKKLKQIHKFIIRTILEYVEYNNNVVYSYSKGTSIRSAVEKHSHNNFFFLTDIKSFYASIKKQNVIDIFNSNNISTPIVDLNLYIDHIIDLMVVDNSLPIGFSTSPILSNLSLFKFDNALEEYCKHANLIYSRYSDDIIISSQNIEQLEDIKIVIQKMLIANLNEYAYINDSKTRIVRKGANFKILGFSILPNGEVTISNKEKKEIETLIYFYINNKDKFIDYIEKNIKIKIKSNIDKSNYDIGVNYLSGKIIALNSMDKKYLDKLRYKYGNTAIELFLRRTVLEI
ncbi:TPA: reverse transcriptase domain-containing protein [Photobacterium damselae]